MDPDLYLAVLSDDINIVLKAKKRLTIDDQRTPENHTVLHLACQYGSIECVNEILSAHESLLGQTNSRGETGLHVAARHGHYGVVEALINKAKSMVPQPYNDLESTSTMVLQNLIRASNVEFETALHAAVRYDRENVVELLVKEDPSFSYPRNKYDETPLYLAAVRSYAGVIEIILDNCESPTFGGPDGRTALHASLMGADSDSKTNECMQLLLRKNKDLIKIADKNGWTAFHYVAHNDLYHLVKFLLDVDRSVVYLGDKKDKRTAIHVATYKGYMRVLGEFLKYLPDAWEGVDGNGQNILHIAVMQNQKEVLQDVLSRKRSFDFVNSLLIQKDKEGNTPLHLIAKFKCYFPQLKDPSQWNADWEVVNNANVTPKDMFHQNQTGILINDIEVLVGETLDRTCGQRTWDEWIQDPYAVSVDEEKKDVKVYQELANSHIIVAALITTVALTAGFAMPGGFDDNLGPNQGSTVLLRKTAFKIFMVADTLTLLFSISSLFLYFLVSIYFDARVVDRLFYSALVLNFVSIAAMMVAFIAGTSAVLSHSSGLIIIVCVICSLFFPLLFYACFNYLRRFLNELKSLRSLL